MTKKAIITVLSLLSSVLLGVQGECPQCVLQKPIQYICGSDGHFYSSICEVNRAACLLGIDIKPLYKGKCTKGGLHVSLSHETYQNITAGSPGKITCNFIGKPESVQWSRQGSSIRGSNTKAQGNSLIFIHPRKKDAGTYICQAFDKRGKQISAKVYVDIIGQKIVKPPTEHRRLLCKEPSSFGDCNKYLVRWYYDEKEQNCKPFVYSGCGGNQNRFKSESTCKGFCMQKAPPKSRVCPESSQSCPLVVQHQCGDDNDCQYGLNCCIHNCVRQCISSVIPEKPGQCPMPTNDTIDCGKTLDDECLSDMDCHGEEKCCIWAHGCERVCMPPEKQVKKCKAVIDLGFLLDASGSIRPQVWPDIISFVKKVLDRFEVSQDGTHVGAITYSSTTELHFRFNTVKGKHYLKEVQNLLNDMTRLNGFTFPYKALGLANQELFSSRGGMRKESKKVAIVVIHGKQTTSKGPVVPLKQASKPLKDRNIQIWAIGVGRDASRQELLDLASSPSNVLTIRSFGDIFGVIDKMTERICNESGPTACQKAYQEALRRNETILPRCLDDGSYSKTQCNRFFCYCVDANGVKIPGSETRIEAGKPRCLEKDKLTPCQKTYARAIVNPSLGQHIPRCKANGMYEEVQCEGKSRECWCVDKSGQRLPGTNTTSTLQCPSHEDSDALTPCQRRYFEASSNPGSDQYIPWCTKEGKYRWHQCHQSYCFCVNKNGDEVPGTRMRTEAGRLNCTAKGAHLTPCQRQLIQYGGRYYYPGRYSPTCKRDGRYEEVQCHPSIGICWCVDSNGLEISGTRSWGSISCTKPKKPLTLCQTRYQELQRKRIEGSHSPWCNEKGEFEPMQCFGPECFCVDNKGATIEGTYVSITQGRPDCNQPTKALKRSKCQITSASDVSQYRTFNHKCTWSGDFEQIQCDSSSRQCWCVHQDGSEMPRTRTTSVFRCPTIGRALPKCQQEYQEKNRQWFLEGRSVPWCTNDGHYQRYQCFRSYCYCVTTQNGVELFKSRMEISRGDAVCSSKAPAETACEGQRRQALSSRNPGTFLPECKQNGDFLEVQCDGLQCFCVNKDGREIPGTRTTNGVKPSCQKMDTTLTPCERAVQEALYRGDGYVPRCTVSGDYQDIQCHATYCWCVNINGQELPGTKTTGSVSCPGKGPFTSPCWTEYQSISRKPSFPGQYVPQCERDGRYSEVQCHVGYCFCVDSTGTERKGFSVDTRHGKPTCERSDDQMTECQAKRSAAMKANPNDIPVIAECTPDGEYSNVQCNRLTKECWCSDSNGVEIENSRTNQTLQCKNKANETLCGKDFFPYSRALIGQWNHVSVCYVNGAYRPIQCDGNKGYCWCVDDNGRSRWDSVLRAIPACKPGYSLSACQDHRRRVLGLRGFVSANTYVPQCNDNGSYKQVQCQTMNDMLYCWCVNDKGKEISRTRQKGRPKECKIRDITPCQEEVEKSLLTEGDQGRFTPRCKASGEYEEVQCNERTGYCWCVDKNGKEVVNTKSKDFIFCPGLGRGLTSCQREYQKAERDKFTSGRFMPRCTPKGEWVDVQCHTSECYCVNEHGFEIYGTRIAMPGKPNCTEAASKPTECQQKRQSLLDNGVPGANIPQCTLKGGFDPVQCRDTVCYCVDQRGNEIQGTQLAIADGKPQCDNPALKLSLCQRQFQEYWRSPISGRYVPRCDSAGRFDVVQCFGPYCFCVDTNGVEKYGTRLLQTSGPVDCSNLKKPLTPCQSELAVIKPPNPNRVIPRCDPDGSYSPVQCDVLSNECWCVDEKNNEITGTRKKGDIICGSPDDSSPRDKCSVKSSDTAFKRFIPGCSPDKSFTPLQCDFRYGYCWCSDTNGNWFPSAIVRGKAVCPGPKYSPCKIHEHMVLGPTGKAQEGAFIPQCLDSGLYDRVQCDGSSSYCWCVDDNGFEEPGTREFGRPNCDEKVGHSGNGNGHEKRSETPCHQARQRVLGLWELPSPRLFVPECDTDGSYKRTQCHETTGHCWCVDKYGQEIPGTRIMGKQTCAPQRNLTVCQRDRMRGLGWNGRLIYGLFVPSCRMDGSFEPIQCQKSTGQCWCVDGMGNELYGTRQSGQVTCEKQVGKTRCQQVALSSIDGKSDPIKCDKDGGFATMQCTIGNGEPRQCWCVDRQGKEIPRTRSSGSIDCNDVSAGLSKCQRERQLTLGWSGQARQDAFIPDCSSDGSYESVQCHQVTGFCWCTDGNGNEIVGTRIRGRPVCTRKASRSSCLIERQRAMGWSRLPNGAFVPDCRPDGRYNPVQCYKGTCWCVNEFGYEMPRTRNKSGRPDCNKKPESFTLCQQWRARILGKAMHSSLPREVFVPECDSEGVFSPKQCHMWTGYCWCVDGFGNVIADTYTNGQLDCAKKQSTTKCQKQRVDSKKNNLNPPVCTKSGGYKLDQCDKSLGECWCVDHLGNEITGSRVKDSAIVCEPADGLTSCQREKRRAHGFVDKAIKGRFVPRCKADGSYDDIQCQDSGYCWCVDAEGVEVLGTRKKGTPLCFAAASLSKCQQEREIVEEQYSLSGDSGQFVPKCRDDGSYDEIQCNRKSGECWCVDDNGRERTGTRQLGEPFDCNEQVYSLCRRERNRALGWTGVYIPNVFVPECKIDGLFEPVQCHAPSGFCWCVNRYGQEIPGTRVKGAASCSRASAVPSMCVMDQLRALIWSEQLDSIYGMFSPACTKDGRYKPVQCNDVTGYCWCVDSRGNELWGTRVRGKAPDCVNNPKNITECTKSLQGGQQRVDYFVGRFVPRCDSIGAYKPVQCDPSGYCWCVDRYGQELPRTKVKGIPKSCGLFAGTTACQRDRFLSMSSNGVSGQGRFEAQCEQQGTYKRLQCDKSSGYCWCVDEFGNEIPRTQSRQRTTCDIDVSKLSRCQYERFLSLPWTDRFSPTCNQDGSYPKRQCQGEYCWCVDKYGNELHRTRTTEDIDCSLPIFQDLETVCQAKERDSSSNNGPVLLCDKFGSFRRVQCMEGAPYCWCVDKYGNEVPRTRVKDVPRCNGQDGLTMCQKERQLALGWTGEAEDGQYVPKCRPNGDYNLVQCHGSTGFCWCVNKLGQEISGTRTKGEPVCVMFGDKTSCEVERWRYLGSMGVAFPGRYVPQCDVKGFYVPHQCHQSTGYCWCVDSYGREIPDTRRPRNGKIYCELPRTISSCYLEQAFSNALSAPNAFRPVCLEDGNYKEIQCSYGRKKKCWCSDENGNALIGTKTSGTPNCTNPDLSKTKCRLARSQALRRLFKRGKVVFIPQCNSVGGYDEIQCYRGVCWCVNNRGTKIPGTRTRGKPDCKMPACLRERMNANYQSIPGRFVPTCRQDGSYEPMQCHSANGYCWCADKFGREIPETRVRGKAICGVKDGSLTSCQRQKKQALRRFGRGVFIPRCSPDGSFAPVQCRKSSCYCVTKDGQEIPGTKTKAPLKPYCNGRDPQKAILAQGDNNCLKRYQFALENFAISRFIPQCRVDGSYAPVQCNEGWYSCWCVDTRNGNELEGTRTTGWPSCAEKDVPEKVTKCQVEYKDALKGYIFGRYVPRCQPDGKYEPMQCHSSLCFCVNEYGVEIVGTREPGLEPLKCKAIVSLTACQSHFQRTISNYALGSFVPRCMPDGSYALVQCDPSHYCWCVDKKGSEVLGTRTKGWPSCGAKEAEPISECHKEFKTKHVSLDSCPPVCKPDGHFYPMQCQAGACFCVTKKGKEIKGTAKQLPRLPTCMEQGQMLSPCQRQRAMAVQRHVVSRYIPSCNPDGTFAKVQCDRGWSCWCADLDGNELPGTRRAGWPDCGAQISKLGLCRRLFLQSLKHLVPGRFRPRCKADGSFDPVQCYGSVCMCVDKYGVEIPGTTKPRIMQPDCSPYGWTLTPCQRHFQHAVRFGSKNYFVPTCNLRGSYEPVQCYRNICFCVDENGLEIKGTRTTLPAKPTCSKQVSRENSSPCLKELDKASKSTDINTFIPRCQDDGSYHNIQCRGLACYCTDNEGNTVKRTKTPRPLRPNCYGSSPTICQKESNVALSEYKSGRYVPTCSSKGDFNKVQIKSEYSFCVGYNGREVLGSRTPKPFNPRCQENVNIAPQMRPDRCPIMIANSPPCNADQCQSNGDCKGGKRCCFDGCSNQCVSDMNEPSADVCRKEMDLALVIQPFPNMERCSWTRVLNFLKSLAAKFQVSADKVNIGIVSKAKILNSFNAQVPKYLNSEEIQRILNNVFNSKEKGSLEQSLKTVDEKLFGPKQGKRANRAKALLLISDGQEPIEVNQRQLKQTVQSLKNKGVLIFAFTIGAQSPSNQISAIVSSPSNSFHEKSLINTNVAVPSLAKALCTDKKCSKVFDIAFLLDASDSIGRSNWNIKKRFINKVLDNFKISERGVHVAFIVYSNNAEILLKFDTLSGNQINSKNVDKYVDKISWTKGYTFIDKALDLADRKIFNEGDGMRKAAPKIMLILTDGKQTRDRGPFTEPSLIAEKIKRKGVQIYSVGIGDSIDKAELNSIASDPSKVVLTESYGSLSNLADNIKELICKGADIRTGKCPRQWKAIFGQSCDGRPNTCTADNQCPPRMKCCKSGCHSQCVLASQAFAMPWNSVCEADKDSGVITCNCEKCPNTTEPVCGSDGETYDNECLMRQASCRLNKSITVARKGKCNPCEDYDCTPKPYSSCKVVDFKAVCACPENCSDKVDFVCGSDGVTYDNECKMRQAACRKEKNITTVLREKCGECPRQWEAIFGQKCDETKDSCTDDNQCPPLMKCCSSGCRKQCVLSQVLAMPWNSVCEADKDSGVITCNCENCPNTTEPVCGSDGETYDNECLMRQASCRLNKSITVARKGKCDPCKDYDCTPKPYSSCKVVDFKAVCACPENCPDKVDFVCGSDGVTYDNECKMRQAACRKEKNITTVLREKCGECPRQWEAIFGQKCDETTDSCTDDNQCPPLMKCCSSGCRKQCVLSQVLAMPWNSVCEADKDSGVITCNCEKCPNTTEPVCGSDGETYDNECLMRQASCRLNKSITVARKGKCNPCEDYDCTLKPYSSCKVVDFKAVCACPENCPDKVDFVCGSDGVTYDNECKMRQAACRKEKNITTVLRGKCGECPRQWEAIFGQKCDETTDSCTGDNQCPPLMKCCSSGCRKQCVLSQVLAMPWNSVCEADKDSGVITCNCEKCPNTTEPVCGSDGETYDNECLMRQASCRLNKSITVARKGKCDPCKDYDCTPKPYSSCKVVDFKAVCACPENCPDKVDFVCGSDGVTYDNECKMRQAACRKEKNITTVLREKCGECPRQWEAIFGQKCDETKDSCTDDNQCPPLMKCCSSGCRKQCVLSQVLAMPWNSVCEADKDSGVITCNCENCPNTTEPVCGSDGETYDNECLMRQASCRLNKSITVARKGKCDPCEDYDCTPKPYSSCIVVDFKAVCACPENCPDKVDFVCGSDGVTYDNECKMRQAACRKEKNITTVLREKCGECPRQWEAIFGQKCDETTDSCTGDNQCPPLMKCCSSGCRKQCVLSQVLAMPWNSVCEADKDSGVITCNCEKCPNTTEPVCGSDGETYDNECLMRQASCRLNKSITVARKGKCNPCEDYDCTPKPYSSCKVVDFKAVCACPEICPLKISFVCGSDGITYDNECQMRRAACRKPAMITVSWKGHCNRCHKFDCSSKPYSKCKVLDDKAVCACPEKCPDKVDLVCGSDGVTYDNECKMRQAACMKEKMITVARKGHCNPCKDYDCSSKPYSICKPVDDKAVCACPEICPLDISLVCGSDGITYNNECQMRRVACRKPLMITINWKGHCNRCHKYDCTSKPYSNCKVVDGKPVCACPEKCPDKVDLVCGSDDVTYDNECKMRQAACRKGKMITLTRKGHCNPCHKYDCSSKPYSSCKVVDDKAVCACPEICPLKISFVCGSDGITYDNECQMRRAACRKPAMITVSWKGHCDRCYKYDCSPKPYSTCEVVDDKAVCACPETCPLDISFVCGSDGITYDNECQMRRAACRKPAMIRVRWQGHCNRCYKYDCSPKPYSSCKVVNNKAVCACPEICPLEISFVCGSDGITYDNECQMRRAACRKPAMIRVRWQGHCNRCYKYDCSPKPYSSCQVVNNKAVCACPEICPLKISFVCGSDGITYDNECQMRRAACRKPAMIRVRWQGHCNRCYKYDCSPKPYSSCKVVNNKAVCACPEICPLKISFVCGSDGITYDNECQMRRAACRKPAMIRVRWQGHCNRCYKYDCSPKPYSSCKVVNNKAVCACPEICPLKISFVCGSDGITYDNECQMRRAACRKPAMITIRWQGHCNRCYKYDCSPKPYSACQVVNEKPVCACPVKCSTKIDLVCGSDGVTYDNECKMRQAACRKEKMITVARKGHCDRCWKYDCTPKPYSTCKVENDKAVCACPVKCSNRVDLVCGSDGVTYDNECKMRQASCRKGKMITVARKGHCDRCWRYDCTRKPYSKCKVENDKAVCACPVNCPKTVNFVCGSNSVTYNNECLMRQASCRSGKMITVRRRGHCDRCYGFDCKRRPFSTCKVRNDKAYCACSVKCPTTKDLVCGSDGITYDNECILQQTACRYYRNIRMRRKGHCDPCHDFKCIPPYSFCKAANDKPLCACPDNCPAKVDPVCGSEGQTFDNECKMQQFSCRTEKLIVTRRKGDCDPCKGFDCSSIPYSSCEAIDDKPTCTCPKTCPKVVKPVCGSNKKSYDNECLMRQASCNRKMLITVAHEGKCDPCANVKCERRIPYSVCKVINEEPVCICQQCVSDIKDPVCASNKQTYSSECKMQEVSCKIRQTLSVESKGKCPCDAIVDLGFLVDSSGSIGRRNWQRMKDFVKLIIRKFKVGPEKTHVSIVEYSTNPAVAFKFNSLRGNQITIENYDILVDKMVWQRGFTYIDKALILAAREVYTVASGMRDDVEKVLIVFTDGEQTKRGEWTPLVEASSYVKNKNVRVYAMGIGKRVSRSELNEISSHPVRNVFAAQSFRSLIPKVQEIIDRVCYPDPCDTVVCSKPHSVCNVIDEVPICQCPLNCSTTKTPVCGSDDVTYDNECSLKKSSCEKGEFIKLIDRKPCKCKIKVDLAFVVDSSGSIGRRNWGRMKQFLSDIVQLFHVGPDGTHVAMVMYSTSPEVVFKFNTLKGSRLTAEEYGKLIMRMRWMRGFTFIDKGIQLANKEVFTTAAGMRGKDVPKVLLVITDGHQTKDQPDKPYTPLSIASKPVKDKGFAVYSLGIGKKFDKTELQDISSNPLRNVYTSTSFKGLKEKAQSIGQSFCPEAVDRCEGVKCTRPYAHCTVENDKPVCKCVKCYNDAVRPVCGSDENTYDNECQLKKEACDTNTMIKIDYRDACDCDTTMDIVFIVDSSGSIGRRNWETKKKFLVSMTDDFNIGPAGTHVAVVTYSTDAVVEFDFNKLKGADISKDNYHKLIKAMKWTRGFTFIDKGLMLAAEKIFDTKYGMRPPSIPKVALVITDGKQTKDRASYTPLSEASALLKNKGVHVYSFGVGKNVNKDELNKIASHPKNDVFQAKSFDDLGQHLQKIIDNVCRKDPKSQFHHR